jgi:3-oxoacyl-[acyl-carrier-protein] synthase-3
VEAGFERHHACGPETTAYDLARQAVRNMGNGLGDPGAIVYVTCIPENANIGSAARFAETRDVKYLMDYPASHLQADFGLDRAKVLGLNQQACTGMLGALGVARMLLLTEPEVGSVLCITADRFPDGALYEQSYNLISDGAAACIVSCAPGGFRLVASHAVTNGAMVRATDEETVGFYFSYTYQAIQDVLRRARRSIGDIAWIVPQNTHRKAWKILSRLLGFDHDRVYAPTIAEIGHMISGDNIVNLKRLVDDAVVRPGELVLMSMAGYGLNWQCVILEKE